MATFLSSGHSWIILYMQKYWFFGKYEIITEGNMYDKKLMKNKRRGSTMNQPFSELATFSWILYA